MGPPNPHVRKSLLWDGDGLGGQACVVVDLAPLTGQTSVRMLAANGGIMYNCTSLWSNAQAQGDL